MIDLQSLFYILAIVTMILSIIVLTALIIIIIRMNMMFQEFRKTTLAKMAAAVNNNIEVSSLVGAGLSSFMLHILRGVFKRR